MMKMLSTIAKLQINAQVLKHKTVQTFINYHTQVLSQPITTSTMSQEMKTAMEESVYVFSGIKTFHILNETFPQIKDENGNIKPFEQFYNDVKNINQKYNRNYLRAEYNFVVHSAIMADKWEGFKTNSSRYYLQYRTAQDERVRQEHKPLHNITLPMEHNFWQQFFPPNGWGCRCNVVQVLKQNHHPTPQQQALKAGEEALKNDKNGMFRFNPGITRKAFPAYNPYTIKQCNTCPIANKTTKSRYSCFGVAAFCCVFCVFCCGSCCFILLVLVL